jgi:hypothetical protein
LKLFLRNQHPTSIDSQNIPSEFIYDRPPKRLRDYPKFGKYRINKVP